ncbi:hypothetical protein [Streptomyces melanogenes]|uniref:hypothetical protein n=1 Tax=Streptomyces melanogenes TaxID=67326 RepID=UPI00167ECA0F|nr:hypothetical protein [Streptomyces melanogenes]
MAADEGEIGQFGLADVCGRRAVRQGGSVCLGAGVGRGVADGLGERVQACDQRVSAPVEGSASRVMSSGMAYVIGTGGVLAGAGEGRG